MIVGTVRIYDLFERRARLGLDSRFEDGMRSFRPFFDFDVPHFTINFLYFDIRIMKEEDSHPIGFDYVVGDS